MNAVKEILRPKESQEGKDTGLVGERAIQLWRLIAPDRKPSSALELETAILPFHYVHKPSAIKSFEVMLFHSILRPYWRTEHDVFRAKLAINPNYFSHGTVDREDPLSFCLEIQAPPPPQLPDVGRTTIFGFAEFPQNKLLGMFNKKPQIDITAESELYTGDLSKVILGKPENLETSPFIPKTKATHKEAMLLSNVIWRKKFAGEVVDLFISVAKQQPKTTHRRIDQAWRANFRAEF